MPIGLWAAVRVLVIVTGDGSEASTRPIENALHAALPSDAVVTIRASSDAPSESTLGASAKAENASTVGVVTWSEHQKQASIRFLDVEQTRWSQRDLRFDARDITSEKARTVGFALASMLPEEALEKPSTPPPPPAAPVAAPPLRFELPSPVREAPSRPAETLPRQNPLAVELVTLGALAADGYGGGVGGTAAVRIPVFGALGVRLGASGRFGEIGPASATSRVFVGAAGLTFQPWVDTNRRWGIGARLDALLIVHQVSHLSDDDVSAKLLGRALPGFDLAVEGTYRFADRAAVVAAAGSEVALGTTEVFMRQQHVASLTPVRGLAEAGIRVVF